MGRPKGTGKYDKAPASIGDYCTDLQKKMKEGLLDMEIYAEWGIHEDTFYEWLRSHPEFKEAYKQGLVKCQAWWIKSLRENYIKGNDKGFKYAQMIMKHKFGWRDDKIQGNVSNTQINIQNMQVISSKDDYTKLLAEVKQQAKELNLIDIPLIDIQVDDSTS